jgi:hypothetical protein
MPRFDQKGMMIFPVPEKIKAAGKMENLLVIRQCFCPNGHNLVSDQAIFDSFNGIILKVRKTGGGGIVALNPVYGLKHRISIGVKLIRDDLLEILCPECGAPLPVYSACSCGGNLVALFLDEKSDFTNSVLICNRVDCHNAQIRLHNEIVNYDDLGNVLFK